MELGVCTNRSRPEFGLEPDRNEQETWGQRNIGSGGFRSGLQSLKLLTPGFLFNPGKTDNILVRTDDPIFFATYEDNSFH